MKTLFSLVISFFLSMVSVAATAGENKKFDPALNAYKGYVRVAPDRELYVDYVKALPGKETVVLLNGLTYTVELWEKVAQKLLAQGLGVLRFDFYGQGQTLLRYAPITKVIPYKNQISDVKNLLTYLQIPAPYNLVGLSYGGGISAGFTAEYPNDVKNLMMISPFTEALHGEDAMIRSKIQATRLFFPLNPATDEELYDFFLHQDVYTIYPTAEPVVLSNPHILEATFRLTQGIRKFRPIDLAKTIPARRLHLVVAMNDQYIPQNVLNEYWDSTPKASQASRLYISGAEHKIPSVVPEMMADWISKIMSNQEIYFQGLDFLGYPLLKQYQQGQTVIKVGQ